VIIRVQDTKLDTGHVEHGKNKQIKVII